MEAGPESDYKFDKLVLFLQHKIKIMPPVDRTKPAHSLGLHSLDSMSTCHRTGPSLLFASRKQKFRIPQTPASTISRYAPSRRDHVRVEREGSFRDMGNR